MSNDNGVFPRVTNFSFVQLILKVEKSTPFRKFRLISLVEFIYKILAKVVFILLKRVLGNMMDQRQSAFIRGRHLLHNTLAANDGFSREIDM